MFVVVLPEIFKKLEDGKPRDIKGQMTKSSGSFLIARLYSMIPGISINIF